MKIFKLRHFEKWLKKQEFSEQTLKNAIKEIEAGLFEAHLGGFLYKKRIPVPGKGKRGGARTILAYKQHKATIFLFGFAKNQKENITLKEKNALNELADLYMNLSDAELEHALQIGELLEVK